MLVQSSVKAKGFPVTGSSARPIFCLGIGGTAAEPDVETVVDFDFILQKHIGKVVARIVWDRPLNGRAGKGTVAGGICRGKS